MDGKRGRRNRFGRRAVRAAMRTTPLPALAIALVVVIAGCVGSAAPSSVGTPGAGSPTAPPASGGPPPSDGNGPGGEDPGGEDPGGDGGGGAPGGGEPGLGGSNPQLVVPQPGQRDLRPVPASRIVAKVEGRRVLLNVHWDSGVEPCSVLDSVRVGREGTTFSVTLVEGTGDPDAVCIMILVAKVVVVDLGELGAGTYSVQAEPGDAEPITVVVP